MINLTAEQLAVIREWIRDIKTQFQRECDEGILKRDLYQSVEAMGGRDACDRIFREFEARLGMYENAREQIRIMESARDRKRRQSK